MNTEVNRPNLILERATWLVAWLLLFSNHSLFSAEPTQASEPRVIAPPAPVPRFENVRKPEVPWSINIIRVPRSNPLYQMQSAHATGRAIGMATLSDQARWASVWGTAVGGVNGDFYERSGSFSGDPRGLQIVAGELISGPAPHSSTFWIDANSEPQTTNVTSGFRVFFPNGSAHTFGLNTQRGGGSVVLYTPSMGSTTRTSGGGRELILEGLPGKDWLPLRPGQNYEARIKEIKSASNSQISPNSMVLSIGPALLNRASPLEAGAQIKFTTATVPSLAGARTAISGGPVLVQGGKGLKIRPPDDEDGGYQFSSMVERHPRSAVGWNKDFFFLIQVDGRARDLSVGMTLTELGKYMASIGCEQAMNLDGGGSSTLWYLGRVRNRPCDGHERTIANSLLVVRQSSTNSPPTRAISTQ